MRFVTLLLCIKQRRRNAQTEEDARLRAERLTEKYEGRFPKAASILEEGLDDSLAFYGSNGVDTRKISSTNMLERLNEEIRRRTRPIGIFPNADSYIRLVTIYLIEYSEDWSANRVYLNQGSLQKLPSRTMQVNRSPNEIANLI